MAVTRCFILLSIFFMVAAGQEDCGLAIAGCVPQSTPTDCDEIAKLMRCVLKAKNQCSQKTWDQATKVFKNKFGIDIKEDVQKDCCDPLNKAKTCQGKSQLRGQFVPTETNCNDMQDLWNCTRPYSNQLTTSCKLPTIANDIATLNKEGVANLDSCVDKGFNVTVDYKGSPGAGNTFTSYPIITMASVITAVVFGAKGLTV